MRPGHPDFARPRPARRLRGAGTRSQQGRSDGPRGRGLSTGGRGPPQLAVPPLQFPVVPQPALPLILPVLPHSPRPLTRLRGPSITSIDPGVSGGPRRNGGAWAHGGAAGATDAAAGGRQLTVPGAGSENPRATAAPLPPPTPRRAAPRGRPCVTAHRVPTSRAGAGAGLRVRMKEKNRESGRG